MHLLGLWFRAYHRYSTLISRGRVGRGDHVYIHCLVLSFLMYNKGTDWWSCLVISKVFAQLMEIVTIRCGLILLSLFSFSETRNEIYFTIFSICNTSFEISCL